MKSSAELEQIVNEKEESEFRFEPVKPSESYDRSTFVRSYGDFEDLQNYTKTLAENPHDLDARKDLSALIFGNPGWHMGKNPEHINTVARTANTHAADNMARYVHSNQSDFFGVLERNPDALVGLINSIPLYKNGVAGHDSFVGLMNDIRVYAQIMQEENSKLKIEKMQDVVAKEVQKNDRIPEYGKQIIAHLIEDASYVVERFNEIFSSKQKKLNKVLRNDGGRGKPDTQMVRTIIENSLNSAWEEYKREPDKKTQNDIWESALRPVYLGMAQAAYKPLKKEKDESNEEKREESVRKNARKKKLIPV